MPGGTGVGPSRRDRSRSRIGSPDRTRTSSPYRSVSPSRTRRVRSAAPGPRPRVTPTIYHQISGTMFVPSRAPTPAPRVVPQILHTHAELRWAVRMLGAELSHMSAIILTTCVTDAPLEMTGRLITEPARRVQEIGQEILELVSLENQAQAAGDGTEPADYFTERAMGVGDHFERVMRPYLQLPSANG